MEDDESKAARFAGVLIHHNDRLLHGAKLGEELEHALCEATATGQHEQQTSRSTQLTAPALTLSGFPRDASDEDFPASRAKKKVRCGTERR